MQEVEDVVPLVIDLDGTLLRGDSLHETFLECLRCNPSVLWRLPAAIFAGRAAIKGLFAQHAMLDVGSWPINTEFVRYVEDEARRGRRIVLATAADHKVAEAVARRFGFISEIIASDGSRNLKGKEKAAELAARFPEGFIYAGDSSADLDVWAEARDVVVVNARDSVCQAVTKVRTPIATFSQPTVTNGALRRSLRLHQWAKNALVFVPLVLGGKVADPWTWALVALGFIALGITASATYVINDLWDLPSDRRHWSKRHRPLASGDLSIQTGLAVAVAGLLAGPAIAALVGLDAFAIVLCYVAITLAYSLKLKRIPVLDVFVLAGLFTLRLGLGIAIADVVLSPWLLVFSMFVFLSLSVAKRHTEILRVQMSGAAHAHGRGYQSEDAPLTLALGVGALLGAVLIMVLYLVEDAFSREVYRHPEVLWSVPALLFLFLGRVWLLAQRGQLNDDPVAFAIRDRASLTLGFVMALATAVAIIGLPLS